MIELTIIGLIVAAVLYAGGRSLWRTWTGKDTGGCAGCSGCGSREGCEAADPPGLRHEADDDPATQIARRHTDE